MQARIDRLRQGIRYEAADGSDDVGCIQLVKPVFFAPSQWIPKPSDWHPRTQSYERYDLESGEGQRVWTACLQRLNPARHLELENTISSPNAAPRYGSPILMAPRLGQGTFRIAVLEAYGRSCAVTGEHSLPALEASHIQPYANEGPHEVRNGLLFRADVHRLFDKGYVTVTPDLRLNVSPRLKDEFHNRRSYYPLHGSAVRSPPLAQLRAAPRVS